MLLIVKVLSCIVLLRKPVKLVVSNAEFTHNSWWHAAGKFSVTWKIIVCMIVNAKLN